MTSYAIDKLEKFLNFDLSLGWCLISKPQYIINDVYSFWPHLTQKIHICIELVNLLL